MSDNRGFVYEGPDWDVGITTGGWIHEECPSWAADVTEYPDEPGVVDELALAEVRSTPMTVRRWWMLTCTDCAQQRIVTDTDYDPDDDALIEAERDRFAAEAAEARAEAALAQYDDDPSPYAGTYSEE